MPQQDRIDDLKELINVQFLNLNRSMEDHRKNRDKEVEVLFKKVDELDKQHEDHLDKKHKPIESRVKILEITAATATGGLSVIVIFFKDIKRFFGL